MFNKILVLIMILFIISSVISDRCYWKNKNDLSPYYNGYIKKYNNCNKACCCVKDDFTNDDRCNNYEICDRFRCKICS